MTRKCGIIRSTHRVGAPSLRPLHTLVPPPCSAFRNRSRYTPCENVAIDEWDRVAYKIPSCVTAALLSSSKQSIVLEQSDPVMNKAIIPKHSSWPHSIIRPLPFAYTVNRQHCTRRVVETTYDHGKPGKCRSLPRSCPRNQSARSQQSAPRTCYNVTKGSTQNEHLIPTVS